MDLWIRSQDKRKLVKSGYLTLFLSDTTWFIYTDTNTGEPFEIGKYKTEERALEVLDEIHKRLERCFEYDSRASYSMETSVFSNKVYQMPKE